MRRKRSKEWYRQAIHDLKTLTDAEILEKYNIVSREITTSLSTFKLEYATYDYTTPAVWVKTHTEKEFAQLVEDYNTIGRIATCAKYKITTSISPYIAKRGLSKRVLVHVLPDRNTIIRHIHECGGVDNLLKNIADKYPYIIGVRMTANLRVKIRRIGEHVTGDTVHVS